MKTELAEHISMLYLQRRNDGLFFVGTKIIQEWLQHVTLQTPSLFRSNCPVFMPREYSNMIELRLDSNIIFYEKDTNYVYNLIDVFAVNGENPISIEIGSWEYGYGVHINKRRNRWERRSDLMGATFSNTLWENAGWADFIYDDNGTIIGSKGWFQEMLFYVVSNLNLTIQTVKKKGFCFEMLEKGLTDVCIGGMAIMVDVDYPIAVDRQAQTLIAGVPTGTAPDAWVYVDVFDVMQWFTLFSLLVIISIILLLIDTLSNEAQKPSIFEGLVMVSMFSIQQGTHPKKRQRVAKTMLAFTTSMLTMLVFVYYSNDITAKMTAGSPPIPVRSFTDVLDLDYMVIVVGTYHLRILEESQIGTAKHSVYKRSFEKYDELISEFENAVTIEPRSLEQYNSEGGQVPHWVDWTTENLDWALDQIIKDLKTLFFCAVSCVGDVLEAGKVVVLKMDDAHITWGGFGLRPDSEYMSLFNHYLLKGIENGILKRYNLIYNPERTPKLKIGLTEPESLGINNVMFLFSILGAATIMSVGIAALEKMMNKTKLVMSKSEQRRMVFIRRNNQVAQQRSGRERGMRRRKDPELVEISD